MAPLGDDGDATMPMQPVPESTGPTVRTPELRQALEAYQGKAPAFASSPPDSLARLQDGARKMGGAVQDTVTRWGERIDAAAREADVAPELVLAVMLQESGGRPDAVSSRGAQGLMQLMPETAREVGVTDLTDPGQNIEGGARYLSRMRNSFGDDLELVLAAYNAGPGNVRQAGNAVPPFTETREYIQKVRGTFEDLGGDSLTFTP